MVRPFLVLPQSNRVVDRIRFWAAAHSITLTDLGRIAFGHVHESNARRPFDVRRKRWQPNEINAVAKALNLDNDERLRLHLFAARELGYEV